MTFLGRDTTGGRRSRRACVVGMQVAGVAVAAPAAADHGATAATVVVDANSFAPFEAELVPGGTVVWEVRQSGHTIDRNGVLTPTDEHTQLVDVIPLGPSASFGFQIVAGAAVGNGDWMIHCHVQRHSDLGMFTFLHVLEPGEAALPTAGSLDTLADATADPAVLQTGTRFRGAAQLPSSPPSGQPDLGYYCSLPLSAWDRARSGIRDGV